MPDPSESQRPRLIIPGAEPEPAPASRIVLPGGEPAAPDLPDAPAAARRPGIVLPPGVGREEPEDLPEYPRMRALAIMPVSDGQREMLLVSDPTGVIPGQPVLSMEALPMLQLLDGTLSLADITAAIMRENKDLRVAGLVRDFVAQLDQMLLLDSPRYHKALQALRDEYHPLEIRPAALESRSYPAAPGELDAFLGGHFTAAARMRDLAAQPAAAAGALPRAILAPHLDPRRAGAVIARAYVEIGEIGPESATAPAPPLRVVIFGTGHTLLGDLFALTRKHFQTPLGKALCDTAFVDQIASRLGDFAYRGELAHREEHSIEFQVLYLQQRLGDRPFTIVPILCGGFYTLLDEGRTPREDPGVDALIAAIREAEATLGGTTLYVAGVDFSHVGPRFGDAKLTDEVKRAVREVDQAALNAAAAGDAEAWFRVIAEQDDATRICGYAPTYVMLRCAEPGTGRALGYAQSEERDSSVVSVAALAWP